MDCSAARLSQRTNVHVEPSETHEVNVKDGVAITAWATWPEKAGMPEESVCSPKEW